MPELPEVETVRHQLQDKLAGQVIESIEVYSAKQTGDDEEYESKLIGQEFADIDRIGKLLIFSFADNPDLFLLGHLRMTGQLLFTSSNSLITGGGHSLSEVDLDLPSKHTRLQFNFVSGDVLYFNDMRKFGYLKIASASEVMVAKSKFGPEPTGANFDCEAFYQLIQSSHRPIKTLLLDQSKIAGLGNIYVDESLFRAKVSPLRPACDVSRRQSDLLCKATGEVMRESIAVGGTTFQNFTDTGGQHGNFRDYLQVFGKQGDKCSRCGDVIKKTKLGGRGTHFCPGCQN